MTGKGKLSRQTGRRWKRGRAALSSEETALRDRAAAFQHDGQPERAAKIEHEADGKRAAVAALSIKLDGIETSLTQSG